MRLKTEPYLSQTNQWPQAGRYILAQFDQHSVVVYQAFRPAIGHFAAEHGYFGGEFSFKRMSWIKPNFLWMMHRCGWGSKKDQEVILAIWLQRSAFEEILAAAVHSSFVPEIYGSETEWKEAVTRSQVRLQWDPDHDPDGNPLERRAIQLGLRGNFLAQYARDWILHIEDISSFVQQQSAYRFVQNRSQLLTPQERIYPVENSNITQRLGLSVQT